MFTNLLNTEYELWETKNIFLLKFNFYIFIVAFVFFIIFHIFRIMYLNYQR